MAFDPVPFQTTPGQKVTRALWNGSLDAIAAATAGSGGTVDVVADRTALAAVNPTAKPLIFLRENGREGLFEWDSSNLSAFVTADTQQGIYVAPASATTGASGAWVRQWDGQSLDARWFGYKADWNGTTGTDNRAAVLAAIAFAGSLGTAFFEYRPGVAITFPPGQAYFATTAGNPVDIRASVHLKGAGGWALGGGPLPTRFVFPPGAPGFAVQLHTSTGYVQTYDGTPRTYGSQTVIDSIRFESGTADVWGGGASYDDTAGADGILVRGYAKIVNCQVRGFKRNGIAVYAGSDNNPLLGNANLFLIEECSIYYNGLHGIEATGTDANAGKIIGNDCSYNRCWGIFEHSFLGNFIGYNHCANNGLGNGTTDIDSVVSYPAGAQRYAVAYGQEAAAATTTPGTNNAIWIPISGATGGRTWVNGITVRAGGPLCIRSTSISLYNYAEGGQGPDQCVSPSITMGGIKGADGSSFAGTGVLLRGNEGNLSTRTGFEVRPFASDALGGLSYRFGGSTDRDVMMLKQSDSDPGIRFTYYDGVYFFDLGSSLLPSLSITSNNTTRQYGRGSNQKNKVSAFELFLGQNDNARAIGSTDTAPSSGTGVGNGEFRFNLAPNITRLHGWHYDGGAGQWLGVPLLTSDGSLDLASGAKVQVNGTQVVSSRQTGTAANATDLATAITLVNDLKAKLVAHGLIS